MDSVRNFVSSIVIYDSAIAAGTCFDAFGLMYVSCLKKDQNWTRYYGDFIHETSHTHLYGLTLFDPIVIDPEETLFMTPLRKEPRPLYMAFHQMYVLARTLMGLNKLWNTKKYNYLKEEGMDISYTGKYVEKDLFDAAILINDNKNKLTDAGMKLFKSAIKESGMNFKFY